MYNNYCEHLHQINLIPVYCKYDTNGYNKDTVHSKLRQYEKR